MKDLAVAARDWGVDLGYYDVFERWHDVSAPTAAKIVEALASECAKPAPRLAPVAPRRIFEGDGRRVWGLAVQLYAVCSERNWGIGDFSDLAGIVRLAAAAGAAAVGLNPLHALLIDRPQDASPYAPDSRCFLNPLYIDIDAIPDFGAREDFEAEIKAARASHLVDYPRIAALKLSALRRCYVRFRARGNERKVDFETFRQEQGEALARFSCFAVLRHSQRNIPWRQWPDPWRRPGREDIEQFRRDQDEECGFYEYLQWIADRQLYACTRLARDLGLGIGLYLDLAVGVDPNGADAWSNQSAVLAELSIGAPPDEFNPGGQNWGLAPFHPHRLAEGDFAVYRHMLRASMKYAGAVRLDHVIGLMRIYLIPREAEAGAYVRYPFESLLQVIAEESQRYHCVFIGEDLGTVPDGFHAIAEKYGMWSYRVMLFEQGQGAVFKPPTDYPRNAVATFDTHDLPTFKGWMSSRDLSVKRAIGIDPGETDGAREHSRAMLRHALAQNAPGCDTDKFPTVAAFLAATPSRVAMVAIEDLLDVVDQVNIPGTTDQYPNWQRKLPLPLEQWQSYPTFDKTIRVFERTEHARKGT